MRVAPPIRLWLDLARQDGSTSDTAQLVAEAADMTRALGLSAEHLVQIHGPMAHR